MGTRGTSTKAKTATKKTKTAKKTAASGKPEKPGNGAGDASRADLSPVSARPSRGQRSADRDRLIEIDATCNAWADIVAERMAADQTFADLVEQYHMQPPRDLRGLILWDALQAAEAHVAMITEVLSRHLEGRRGDPVEILGDLRARQRRIAAVYAVNAFLAVLNQMSQEKPKWLSMDFLDPRFAVLALAHQTLGYAIEAAQVSAPPDLTEQIIEATQDPTVWVWRRMPEPGTDTLAACAATAAFFRSLDSSVMTSTDEVAALYAAHGRA
ncbi:MAG: hypothetical protein H6719_28905 [Sandaracinaceae bacterium]|nr:hypothetical protein [Sandaracinaceae bacterium]